ncbi:GSCFA family protein, partial [Rhizobium sp. RU35A]
LFVCETVAFHPLVLSMGQSLLQNGLVQRGKVIQDATRQIIHATDVFIITLGLSEIWYDKRSGDALWRAVPADLFDEEIHGFRVSTH